MSKPLDERVKKILKELDFDPKECLWDCHNTWVMYHRFVEIAGAKHNIEYELYDIERNSIEGIVCIKCVASIKSIGITPVQVTKVSTYGEASPKNNKNPYPWAMAEKRAVDRAILKLLGLHGFIYSEDEMDLESDQSKIARKTMKTPRKIPENLDEPILPPRVSFERGEEEYLNLDEDEKLHANATASAIRTMYATGDTGMKLKAYQEHISGAGDDFKLALWHVMKKDTVIRASLTQIRNNIKTQDVPQ